jgi:hypothetical protein
LQHHTDEEAADLVASILVRLGRNELVYKLVSDLDMRIAVGRLDFARHTLKVVMNQLVFAIEGLTRSKRIIYLSRTH